jgi:hypothetical protein
MPLKNEKLICRHPDRHNPKLVCGYPLPCPFHTVIVTEKQLFDLVEKVKTCIESTVFERIEEIELSITKPEPK